MPSLNPFTRLGPGLVMAATGLGAGDLIAAAVAGAQFGTALLWAVLVGALLKFALTEGLARWQLVTGTTLLEGWLTHLPRLVSGYFIVYLCLWGFVVGGALMSACGLAAHALFPQISVAGWGVAHSLLALALVGLGRYQWLERLMAVFIALMFGVVLVCGYLVAPPVRLLAEAMLQPTLPVDSLPFVLGVIGGVGGSVTLLSYGYWIREKGWHGRQHIGRTRVDLLVAYLLTAGFGAAILILAADLRPEQMSGSRMVLAMGERMGEIVGPTGQTLFLVGFWGAVFSSMLGVWQGVPYLFSDFVTHWRSRPAGPSPRKGTAYRGFMLFLALPPMLLLLADRPVWVVVAYAVTGALFMPLLAAVLLYLGNFRQLGRLRNRFWQNLLLLTAFILFAWLFIYELQQRWLTGTT